jgi:iron complex outermembrane receptor protein
MPFKPSLLLLNCFLFFSFLTRAQDIPVTIKIINQKKEPVAFASVTVINRLDSTKTMKKVADSSGITHFELARNNQYTVLVSSVNYQPIEKGITVTGGQNFFSLVAEPVGKTMEAVVVTAKKPLMKQEDDKLIVDPSNLVEASTSSYEVIEKTPGLFVDQDGNVYISSLTPATVQINGRDMKMSAADIATMLKNLPPSSIAKIEIIKTP